MRVHLLKSMLIVLMLSSAQVVAQVVALEDISFVSLPGDRFEIELGFSGRPPAPQIFEIENPARLSMDFIDVISRLETRRYPLGFSNADSVIVLESQGRTRLVVNLNSPVAYSSRVQGNSLFIIIGADANPVAAQGVLAAAAQGAASQAQVTPALRPQNAANFGDINNVDFRLGPNGEGLIVIDLARQSLIGSVSRVGEQLELEFLNAELDESQQVRLDVTDFATPVQYINVYTENDNVMIVADIVGRYEYIAYQSGGEYILSVSSALAIATAGGLEEAFEFEGDRINLSLQDVDVRSVLLILADIIDFSLVVSDTVSGNITLRLVNVPWDQALDLVLRTRGLDQRIVGTVLYVAPAEEIARAELLELENNQQVEALAPLQTEYIEVNYAVASDLLALLSGGGEIGNGLLSGRGSARVDERTNTLIVQDVASVLTEIRDMLNILDIPVRQVLIEARIVNASTSFSRNLGIRWGGVQTFPGTGDQFILGGSMATTIEQSNNLSAFSETIAGAVIGGTSLADALALNSVPAVTFPDALSIDLGVTNFTSSIALGFAGNNGLLELELSALEASGNGEVIAEPKVTTQDQQLARIESGVQIPYQAQAGGTAGGSTTEFISAVLSLEVTPQITPDGRIIMLLDIHQDSIVPGQGDVPAIATNSVTTRVLVNDGDTIVLGGVFREEITTVVSKTPLLGDIPYLGNLFKRTENNETKTELLIFITPSIINDLP